MSYHATKSDLKNATSVDTSKFAKKVDLASLKSEFDKLDTHNLENVRSGSNSLTNKVDKWVVDTLKLVPTNLKKLSDVVENEVVKKDVYNELVEKVNTVDTSKLVNKTVYNAKIKDTED